jgi:hypothetical protein
MGPVRCLLGIRDLRYLGAVVNIPFINVYRYLRKSGFTFWNAVKRAWAKC